MNFLKVTAGGKKINIVSSKITAISECTENRFGWKSDIFVENDEDPFKAEESPNEIIDMLAEV